jgi:hypothetical protein
MTWLPPGNKNVSKIIPCFFAVAGIGSISRPAIYHTERTKIKREKMEMAISPLQLCGMGLRGIEENLNDGIKHGLLTISCF